MRILTLAIATSLSGFTTPVFAHHSFAMFENDKTVVMTGTVKQMEWVNPHSWLHVVVMNSAGKPEEWSFEMGSPGTMALRGWNMNSISVGEEVTVTAHPMKDITTHGGSEIAVKLPDGTNFGTGKYGRGAYY